MRPGTTLNCALAGTTQTFPSGNVERGRSASELIDSEHSVAEGSQRVAKHRMQPLQAITAFSVEIEAFATATAVLPESCCSKRKFMLAVTQTFS